MAGKSLQPVQRAGGVEGLGIQFQGGVRRIAAGAATGGFFAPGGVGRRVGAEKEAWAAGGGGAQQGFLVRVALQHRQAVVVRANAAHQHVVAVEQQVVRGDGCRDIARCRADKVHRIGGGDVFQYHAQPGEALHNRRQVAIDEHLFPIENVHAVVGDLTVDKQRQVCVLHGFQRGVEGFQFSDAGLRVGGGAGGVQFHRV